MSETLPRKETVGSAALAGILDEIRAGAFPHTCVLEGKDALHRRSAALYCASALLCTGEGGSVPCGVCDACRKVASLRHPDVTVVSPAPGAPVRVEDIRRVRTDAFVMPFEAEVKVVILEEAQTMNVQSQNALLKILEEPPERVYFLLTSPASSMLLPTVRSRCVAFPLGPLGYAELYAAVRELLPRESDEVCARYAACVACLDGFAVTADALASLKTALAACDAFYRDGLFPFSALRSGKEGAQQTKLLFKLLALGALEIAESKKEGLRRESVLGAETLRTAVSRLPFKKAFALYELFCDAQERLEANANANAVLAQVRCSLPTA